MTTTLTPSQVTACLDLMEDVDTQILRYRVFYRPFQPYWLTVKGVLQALIDGDDRHGTAPFQVHMACLNQGWASARVFKDAFGRTIGRVSGTIAQGGQNGPM